jgi:hypothetical protein
VFIDHCWLPPMIAGLTHKMVAITDPESAPGFVGIYTYMYVIHKFMLYIYLCIQIHMYVRTIKLKRSHKYVCIFFIHIFTHKMVAITDPESAPGFVGIYI